MYCIKCGKNIPKDSLYCPKCGTQQKGIRPHYSNQPIDESVKTNIATIIGAILVLIALVFNAIAIFKTSAPLEYYTIWDLFAITGTTISLIGLFGCLEKDEKGKKPCNIRYCNRLAFVFIRSAGNYSIFNFII